MDSRTKNQRIAAEQGRYQAEVDELTRRTQRLGKGSDRKPEMSAQSGLTEREKHLLIMLKEVQESKRRQNLGKNPQQEQQFEREAVGPPTQDVLPWCDGPKGGNKQQFQNRRRGFDGPNQEASESSFEFVNFNDFNKEKNFARNVQDPSSRTHHFQKKGYQNFRGNAPHPNHGQKPNYGRQPADRGGHQMPFHHAAGRGQPYVRGRGKYTPRGAQVRNRNQHHGGMQQTVYAEQEGMVADVTVRLNSQQRRFMSSTDNISTQFTPEEIVAMKNVLRNEMTENKKPKKKNKKKTVKVEKSEDESNSESESDDDDDSDETRPIEAAPLKLKSSCAPDKPKRNRKKNKKAVPSQPESAPAAKTTVPSELEGAVGGAVKTTGDKLDENFKVFLGSGLDESVLQMFDKNQPIKDVLMVAKKGDSIINIQPRTIKELLDFKKMYPNAEPVILK